MRGPARPGFSPFGAVNRNKRSLAIDLAAPDGAAAVRRMARTADVVVENYRHGALPKLGLGYRDLAAGNPALIYCSISGFGATGPYATRGGFDLVAQGMSGIMSFTGEPDRPPVKVGVPIADLNAGLFGAFGVVSAYVHRQRTGEGQYVDTSLFEGALAYTVWESALYFATGEVAGPIGSAHRLAAPYEALRTADGWLTVGAANQANWRRLCEVLGRPDLLDDERFARPLDRLANRRDLAVAIEKTLATATTSEWVARLEEGAVPAGPIYDVADAFADPHVAAREMIVDIADGDSSTRHLGVPVKLSRTPGRVVRNAPRLGAHTDEVLGEYGFSTDEIQALHDAGVIRRG
jgi:crotonobetainyl-CoA:carnitine CoA-transferase CaiB-like acyl-CoA transferase